MIFHTHTQSLESELASTKKEVNDNTVKYEHELEMLRLSKSSLQRSVEQLDSDLKVSRMEVARMTADASAIQCQLDATKVLTILVPCNNTVVRLTAKNEIFLY